MTKGWQTINRAIIEDDTMSDRARFLYIYMASMPENWNFYHAAIRKKLGYSEDTLRKYLNELKEHGLLVVGEQTNDGQFGAVEYTLLDSPPDTKNSVTEKFRNGKIPQQRNKQYIEINNNNIKKKEKYTTNVVYKKKEEPSDFEKVFNETAEKMMTDDRVAMMLSGYNITNLGALLGEWKKHIIKNLKQNDFIKNGYMNNCQYLSMCMRYLDLNKATGVNLGKGEYIRDGRRYYINPYGNETEVPMDAPPRELSDQIWYAEFKRWGPI